MRREKERNMRARARGGKRTTAERARDFSCNDDDLEASGLSHARTLSVSPAIRSSRRRTEEPHGISETFRAVDSSSIHHDGCFERFGFVAPSRG